MPSYALPLRFLAGCLGCAIACNTSPAASAAPPLSSVSGSIGAVELVGMRPSDTLTVNVHRGINFASEGPEKVIDRQYEQPRLPRGGPEQIRKIKWKFVKFGNRRLIKSCKISETKTKASISKALQIQWGRAAAGIEANLNLQNANRMTLTRENLV